MNCPPRQTSRTPPIPGGGTAGLDEHVAETDPHPGYQLEDERGQPGGYASLDIAGTVPVSELPTATTSTAGVVSIDVIHGYRAPDVFGTGADGDFVVTANPFTLTRDADFENLTIASGARLVTAGFRLRVLNTLTWNGTISCDGTEASGPTAGIGGGGGGTNCPYATGTDGAAGVSSDAGASSTNNNNNWGALHVAGRCKGGSGGGSGGGQVGGSGGDVDEPPSNAGSEHSLTWETGYLNGQVVVRLKPGTGGGSGGARAGSTSGGGGGGGGICAVFARRISGSGGTLSAVGGKGGDALAAGPGAGGGGGGGGGIVIGRYMELTTGASLPTVLVSGGAGGQGKGSGINGSAGTQGFSSLRRLVRS